MIETLEIERMTFAERVRAMELLWRSMSAQPGKLASPAWHKTVLHKRLAKVEAGKGEFLTLAQLKRRLAKHELGRDGEVAEHPARGAPGAGPALRWTRHQRTAPDQLAALGRGFDFTPGEVSYN